MYNPCDCISFDSSLETLGDLPPQPAGTPFDKIAKLLWEDVSRSNQVAQKTPGVQIRYQVWPMPDRLAPDMGNINIREQTRGAPVQVAATGRTPARTIAAPWKQTNSWATYIHLPPAFSQGYYNTSKGSYDKRYLSGTQLTTLLKTLLEANQAFMKTERGARQMAGEKGQAALGLRPAAAASILMPVVTATPSTEARSSTPVVARGTASKFAPTSSIQLAPKALETVTAFQPAVTAATEMGPVAQAWQRQAASITVDLPESIKERLALIAEMLRDAKTQRLATSEHKGILNTVLFRRRMAGLLRDLESRGASKNQCSRVVEVILRRA